MSSLLDQLKKHSTVVADTGDLEAIAKFEPVDATTNPSLVLKAALSGQYDDMIDGLVAKVAAMPGSLDAKVEEAGDRLTVEMGRLILQRITGRVSTEVDARLSFDTQASLEKARRLVRLYDEAGVPSNRILIKLAATWEGIRAAEILEQEGIQCNLTLVFSFVQARACAEAGAFLISPFVGRILDWHRQQNPEVDFEPQEEPGVQSVRTIQDYFRRQGYPTIVMGASFRNVGEVLALAGCDRLTISPQLLEELAQSDGEIVPDLSDSLKGAPVASEPISEPEFRWSLNDDAMATEKLAEGIRGFHKDQLQLEKMLGEKLLKRGA